MVFMRCKLVDEQVGSLVGMENTGRADKADRLPFHDGKPQELAFAGKKSACLLGGNTSLFVWGFGLN